MAELQEVEFKVGGSANFAALLEENFGGAAPQLTRVTMPQSGGSKFRLPTVTGDEEVDFIEGVIVYQHETRAYWSKAFGQGDASPDCSSNDAVVGHGNPGGPCIDCRFAQWGSDPRGGDGQACSLRQPLYVLRSGAILPIVLNLSPGSLKPWREYAQRLFDQGIGLRTVVTKLALGKKPGTRGDYAVIAPVAIGKLSNDARQAVHNMATGIKQLAGGRGSLTALTGPGVTAEDVPIPDAVDAQRPGLIPTETGQFEVTIEQDPEMRYDAEGMAHTILPLKRQVGEGFADHEIFAAVGHAQVAELLSQYQAGARLLVKGQQIELQGRPFFQVDSVEDAPSAAPPAAAPVLAEGPPAPTKPWTDDLPF